MKPSVPVLSVVAIIGVIVTLQHGLPSETFFAGDSGVKLIAVKNAIAHPWHPLEIPLPVISGKTFAYLDPFFFVHGNHSHVATPELFPIVSAPLYAQFGSRGVFVLPAVSAALGLFAWSWIGQVLDSRRRAHLIVWILAVSSPLIFYALEFWEHAPSFGIGSLGLGLLLASLRLNIHRSSSLVAMRVCSGFFFGVSFLLRPEGGLFAFASIISMAISVPSSRSVTYLGELLAGFIAAVAPLTVYDLAHFGALTGPHLSTNAGALMSDRWGAVRWQILEAWFIKPTRSHLLTVAPALSLAVLQFWPRFRMRGTQFFVLLSLIYLLLTVLTAPNDGGAQWGPRYLLFLYGPLCVLVADSLQTIPAATAIRAIAVGLVLCGSIWVQRAAYKSLRTTKQIYAHVLAFVRDSSPDDGWVTTDLWWLDQVAASATPSRHFLYAVSENELNRLNGDLHAVGVEQLTTVVSKAEPYTSVSRIATPGCKTIKVRTIADRELIAISLRCDVN